MDFIISIVIFVLKPLMAIFYLACGFVVRDFLFINDVIRIDSYGRNEKIIEMMQKLVDLLIIFIWPACFVVVVAFGLSVVIIMATEKIKNFLMQLA